MSESPRPSLEKISLPDPWKVGRTEDLQYPRRQPGLLWTLCESGRCPFDSELLRETVMNWRRRYEHPSNCDRLSQMLAAAEGGIGALMRLLIFWGERWNDRDSAGFTALTSALRSTLGPEHPWGFEAVEEEPLHVLQEMGATFGIVEAVILGDVPLTRKLLAEGSCPNACLGGDYGPILSWAASAGDIPMAEAILDAGASIEGKSDQGVTPLIEALDSRRNEMVDFLLNRGADVNHIDDLGRNVLGIAAATGRWQMAERLRKRGARSSLLYAVVTRNKAEVVKYLKSGAKADGYACNGRWIIDLALGYEDLRIFGRLLDRLLADRGGWVGYVITRAAAEGRADAVRLLLDRGVDPEEHEYGGRTALQIAREKGHTEILALLEAAAADKKRNSRWFFERE